MNDIYLVSCVSAKREQVAPAAELYTSTLFCKARAYVESREPRPRWFVLSALHGLLHPSEEIGPYDVTLNTMPRTDREAWGHRVVSSLRKLADPAQDRLVFLAGAKYRAPLMSQLLADGYVTAVPMEGLTIGRQLRWLSQQNQPVPSSYSAIAARMEPCTAGESCER